MTNTFLANTGFYLPITVDELPEISDLSGLLDIGQIAPSGLTGQHIQDVGDNALRWRYLNHVAGEGGYYLLPFFWMPTGTSLGTFYLEAADVVEVLRIFIPCTISIATLSFKVVDDSAGQFASVGLYDLHGDLVLHSGAIGTDTVGIKTGTLSGIGTILPGIYYWAWTADSSLVGFAMLPEDIDYMNFLNDTVVHRGRAAEASVAGVLPATLGVITASVTPWESIAVGKLQG